MAEFPEVLRFQKDQIFNFEDILNSFVILGYRWKDCVELPGDFSHRGYIIDIFAFDRIHPVRFELFDNRIERLTAFNHKDGNIIEELNVVIIVPAGIKSLSSLQFKSFIESENISKFTDFEEGDFVVHFQHGIGKYLGRKKLKCPEKEELKNYLVVEYRDKNRLYVPIEDISMVRRYVGIDKRAPNLSRLGTKFWEKTKQKAYRAVQSLASGLVMLQAVRISKKGFAFSKDGLWQEEFESGFPYTETPDQIRSWLETKKDMEMEKPMDRLICGDVGYGKTEVALRAAFKAVMSNKQVAILTPTTLLAEQHCLIFKQRFKNFPVEISMLSRFVTPHQQKATVLAASEGKTDIVIGTHRLLSSDMGFKDLGLVIIDEEQRFGVRHKERFKRLRLLVDVLTLTATPIPRTLYMSLTGVRDMSIINTPPLSRIPVKTTVCRFSGDIVREGILKEIKRGGQVFFVHNRVETIEGVAKKISSIVPGVKIASAHGQMPGRVLEDVMKQFLQKNISVLVCTCIIESGLDIPNANTIFIDNADMFGLADLYQLRGRVGRSDIPATCYLLVQDRSILTSDAKERLSCMEKWTELGSGFRVAMEDLQIRGAGNLLGIEQSGHIGAVGFDLYCRLLKDAIEQVKEKGEITDSEKITFLDRNNLARRPELCGCT
ncbi:transcription-repair coupling factor [bacterium Unc6]|nr:transcription-repair coupling factor [bacterium Unc6]